MNNKNKKIRIASRGNRILIYFLPCDRKVLTFVPCILCQNFFSASCCVLAGASLYKFICELKFIRWDRFELIALQQQSNLFLLNSRCP